MRKFILFLFLLLCFASISSSFAAYEGDTEIEISSTNHYYDENQSILQVEGNLRGYARYDIYGHVESYPHGLEDVNVTLKVDGKNYTEKTGYAGSFYFDIPLKTGTYDYNVSYDGNWIYNPASYSNSYTIPKKSSILKTTTKLGTNKIFVTTQLYEYDSEYDETNTLSGKIIRVSIGNKNYYGKTNSNGITTITIPSSTGKKNLLISFLGTDIHTGKTISKSLNINSNSIISTKNSDKFIKYFEKNGYLYKKYKRTTRNYYFNGKTKTTIKYINKYLNRVKTVSFGSRSFSKVLEWYEDGYLQVDKYAYLKKIGIYDYVYNERYLDYFKIYYNSGKVKKVKCTHFYSTYWIFSSKSVKKIKFYFF